MPAPVVVIGVGNPYRRDDGLGPAVLDLLRDNGAEARLVADDGDIGRLLDAWTGAALAVVVDAVRAEPAQPGRVHRFRVPGPVPAGPAQASSHGLGLGEAVELARVLGRLPERLELFAVEVADTGVGTGLSAPVAAAAAEVAADVAELIRLEVARCA